MKKQNKKKDCSLNGEFVNENTRNKVSIRIKELNCYILVKSEKVDTIEKKAAYIKNYIGKVNECRNGNRDLNFNM